MPDGKPPWERPSVRDAVIDVAYAGGKLSSACQVVCNAVREIREVLSQGDPQVKARFARTDEALSLAADSLEDCFADFENTLRALGEPLD